MSKNGLTLRGVEKENYPNTVVLSLQYVKVLWCAVLTVCTDAGVPTLFIFRKHSVQSSRPYPAWMAHKGTAVAEKQPQFSLQLMSGELQQHTRDNGLKLFLV